MPTRHLPAGVMLTIRPIVRCRNCGHVVFDGLMIKARVVRVLASGAQAKCLCKRWLAVPVTYEA